MSTVAPERRPPGGPPPAGSAGGDAPPTLPIRPPRSRTRLTLWALAALALVLTYLSAWYLKFDVGTLASGLEAAGNLIERMLPPEIDDTGRVVDLAIDTLLIAFLGTVVATVLSVPLAFLAARNTTPHPAVAALARAVITFSRAVPDLVFAIILVRAIGIGVLPGVLALALHSVGMLGKLFADAIEEVDEGPREAVRSVGVGRVRELITAVMPQVMPSWIGTFVYRIDINLRTSVVLGFVGAGGIGFALQSSLRTLNYDRALGMVLVIFVLLAAMEVLASVVRRLLLVPSTGHQRRERIAKRVLGVGVVLLTAYSFVDLRINPLEMVTSVPDVLEVATRMLPPDFTLVGDRLTEAVLQTVAIGMLATSIGVALSVPLGLLAARTVTPHPAVGWGARLLILAVRSVPELILAVVFVAAVGLGPVAGVCALAIGSIGFLGKLVADAVEEIDPGPVEAIRSVGGGWWKVLVSGIIAQSVPRLVGSVLYLLDVNIRQSTVLGIVGAGGVGFLLYEAVRTLQFQFAGGIILIIFAIVLIIERLSGWIRAKVA